MQSKRNVKWLFSERFEDLQKENSFLSFLFPAQSHWDQAFVKTLYLTLVYLMRVDVSSLHIHDMQMSLCLSSSRWDARHFTDNETFEIQFWIFEDNIY